MHRAARSCLFLAAIASAPRASAEPDPGTVESALRAGALTDDDDRGFHAQAFAQLGADSVAGAGAAGGELRYHGARCDYVRAGGQVRLGVDDGAHMSAEQWASVCIPVITMEFGHHLEWDVRPALLAPLGLRQGHNRRETLRFHWQPLRAPLPKLFAAMARAEARKQGRPELLVTPAEEAAMPQGELILFDVDLRHTALWDASRMGSAAWVEQVEAVPIRYQHDGFALDIGAGGGEFNDHGALIHVWLVKLERLALGPVRATGGIGVASGSAGPFVDAVSREISVTSPRAVLGVEVGDAALGGYLRGTRDVALVPDGYVTVDSRLGAGVAVATAATSLTLDLGLARTEVHVPGMARAGAAATGGGALAVAHRLTRYLDVTAQLEVARSYYATDVASLALTPRWGVTGFAALQASIGR